MNNVIAIIVTYNRLELLKECLEAVLSQEKQCDILVINNCSTDGTEEYLDTLSYTNLFIKKTTENIGGAGGFSVGIDEAIRRGYDFAWLMDDDTIPEKTALLSLVEKATKLNNQFSFISGIAQWQDNTLCLMNVQKISSNWYKNYEVLNEGLIPIDDATFVSYFINLRVAKKVGLPIKEFFIYADDWEYSLRLGKEMPGYLDIDCRVIHKMKDNSKADITTCPDSRIERCYYDIRNHYYVLRKYGSKRNQIRFVMDRLGDFWTIITSKSNTKFRRIKVLIKGFFAGKRFNPSIEYTK